MIGQQIAHYTITERLGAGGMGEVFLATDTKLDRQVALKFLPPEIWNETEARQRLIREAKAASKLDHPNVVTIFGIEESAGRLFISMANVRGTTLKEYCGSQPRPITELVELALQIADGLEHAHEVGVVHRDLKPSNIIVDDRGRARILDFGLASYHGAAKLTLTGSTVGTLSYAPPEVVHGKPAEPASDIYSFGVVMYQMFTGRLPFEAEHDAALLYSILHEDPQPLSDHIAELPDGLQAIISRCLEKDPANRYPSGTELIADLLELLPRSDSASEPDVAIQRPSIAVLPFVNMSADPENEFFSDGLSEELLNVLAKNPGLRVTGRTSSFAFKGKHEDLREIGQKLGVESLLEGSVRKAGNRVRITAQLVKVSDGFHLWTETYDRVLEDIFAVQDDIAGAVGTALHVTLLGKPTSTPKGNAESFSLVLQANELAYRMTKESLAGAIELYQEALAKDSDDAHAWAALSNAYASQAGHGHADSLQGYADSKRAAQKALALDDQLPHAHTMMGWIYMAFEFRWREAGQAFERAYELAPSDSRVLIGLASFNSILGNFDEAGRLARESVDLDPLNPVTHLFRGRVQTWMRRYESAAQSYSRALEISPGITTAHANRGLVYLLQGRQEEALVESLREESAGYRCYSSSIIFNALGQTEESDEALAVLLDEGEQWAYQVACVYAYRNELDKAFEWLERSYALRDAGIPITKVTPLLDGLHGDPRWPAFLKRIGLEA